MQNAVVLAVTFERPANFDLAAHWKTATAQLQQKREQFRATLAVAADTAASSRAGAAFHPLPIALCSPPSRRLDHSSCFV